jgi:hypothetical protein
MAVGGHARKQEKLIPIVATIVTMAAKNAGVAPDWSKAIAMKMIGIA